VEPPIGDEERDDAKPVSMSTGVVPPGDAGRFLDVGPSTLVEPPRGRRLLADPKAPVKGSAP
jgi:hypothetical protein